MPRHKPAPPIHTYRIETDTSEAFLSHVDVAGKPGHSLYSVAAGPELLEPGETSLLDRGVMRDKLDLEGLQRYLRRKGLIDSKAMVVLPLYRYRIDLDERGSFRAAVADSNDKDLYTIRSGDELDPDETSIFEDGFMANKNDLSGLCSYLCELGVLPPGATVLSDHAMDDRLHRLRTGGWGSRPQPSPSVRQKNHR